MFLMLLGARPAADPVFRWCLVAFCVLYAVLLVVCCSFKFESTMNVFMICVAAALAEVVLVGKTFED